MTWGVVFLFVMGSFIVVLCPDKLGDTVILPFIVVVVGRFIADSSVKAAIGVFRIVLCALFLLCHIRLSAH
jgi:hypothetical protein